MAQRAGQGRIGCHGFEPLIGGRLHWRFEILRFKKKSRYRYPIDLSAKSNESYRIFNSSSPSPATPGGGKERYRRICHARPFEGRARFSGSELANGGADIPVCRESVSGGHSCPPEPIRIRSAGRECPALADSGRQECLPHQTLWMSTVTPARKFGHAPFDLSSAHGLSNSIHLS